GIPSVVAGNIGTALSEVVPALTRDHWVVAELSSFQLETIVSFRPRIALLLNLAPDHLDRYADAADYYRAKARIFENQGPEDTAVLNAEDPLVPVYARDLRARRLFFSRTRAVEEGACLREGQIVLRRAGQPAAVCPAGAVRILGLHNLENALAAAAAAAAAGATPAAIGAALREFPGLPHRLEPVGERDGVRFINDSKGTNVGAVQKSLESFARGVILIAGGKDKGGDFAPLRPLLERRVKRLLLLGEAAGTIREQLRGACPMETVATLEEAVRRGAALAEAGDTVLLSPACASFDMFRDFEQRGDVFRRAVQELLGRRGGERANG
ncbi:MAG: UDP-N-acetylmuramoyl-L-alanine--D-glutamate ligase, partial [Candidatus Methylomirabilota bacterium]